MPSEKEQDLTGYVSFHRATSMSWDRAASAWKNRRELYNKEPLGPYLCPPLPLSSLPTFTMSLRLISSRKSGACWERAQGRGFSLLPAPGG